MRVGDDLQAVGGHRFGERADRRRVLGVDVAAAAATVAVVHAARAIVIGQRVDRRRAGEGVPAKPCGRRRHALGEPGAAQRRHRVGALARSLEDVTARIDLAVDVAGLAGNADLVFHLVVVGLEFLKPERPILHR